MPKVSIIIIIYKVERFLAQCLESVVSQTYQNLEIICVLGKGDMACEEICEHYAKKDDRIVLLKEEPRGTAAARNQGLDKAHGDYIGFVDGDDYIAPDMIEVMVNAAMMNHAEISIVGKYYSYENRIDGDEENQEYLLSTEQAFEMILYQEGFFLHLWDKLYQRRLFEHVRFPEGKLVEDRQIAYRLLSEAENIVYNKQSKYYFRVSEDSGSRVEKNLQLSLMEDDIICEALLKTYPGLGAAVDFFLVYENMSVIQNSILFHSFSREHDREYLSYVREHGRQVKKNPRVPKSLKLKIDLCNYFLPVFVSLTKVRRNKFLKEHISWKTGTDWSETYKRQGL